jgi:hypothetical protein
MTSADLLSKRAYLTPDREAMYDVASGNRYTYAQLNERANRAANLLSGRYGIKKGERVSILAHNGIAYVDLLYGLGKLGALVSNGASTMVTLSADGDGNVGELDSKGASAETPPGVAVGAGKLGALCRSGGDAVTSPGVAVGVGKLGSLVSRTAVAVIELVAVGAGKVVELCRSGGFAVTSPGVAVGAGNVGVDSSSGAVAVCEPSPTPSGIWTRGRQYQ